MLEDLLLDLSTTGWTISWAYQHRLGGWRMSIIQEIDIGEEQGTYTTHCVDAPTFAEALEDCLAKRAQAEFEATTPTTFAKEPTIAKPSLLAALGLHLPTTSSPIRRRV